MNQIAIVAREQEVEKAMEDLDIPNIEVFNNIDEENHKLYDLINTKLYDALTRYQSSPQSSNYFEWFLDDFKKCANTQQFCWVLETQYTPNGEEYSDDNYSFDLDS